MQLAGNQHNRIKIAKEEKMREFVISIYEWMLILLLALAVAAGFYIGYKITPYNPSGFNGFIGALIGFLTAVPVVGHFFTVLSMKESLEWQTRKIGNLESKLEQIIAQQAKK